MSESVTRLHITPFSAELLSAVLGPSLKSAQEISYHTLETFAENNYGFVNLPTMEAEKVKKKLNGAILKGKKIKVEEARPKKRRHADTEEDRGAEDVANSAPRKSKKSKKESNVVEGHELSPDRKVKRGWTEPKSEKIKKKKEKRSKTEKSEALQAPSRYTEKEELLFRTKVPPNKKDLEKSSKKKDKKKSSASVVHEFEKATMVPSFLRDTKPVGSNGALEYRDGEGWVDGQGSIVEPESKKVSKKRKAAKAGIEEDVIKAQSKTRTEEPDKKRPVLSPSSPSSAEEDEDEDEHESTSSSGSSDSDSNSESETEVTPKSQSKNRPPSIMLTPKGPTTPSAEKTVPSEIEPNTESEKSIHPLEALFKKPRKPLNRDAVKPSLEVSTAFSFFVNDNNDDIEEDPDQNRDGERDSNLPPMPMTPFSSQDFNNRITRSAAPTPDTAHPSRMGSYGPSLLGGDEEDTDSDLSSNPETLTKKYNNHHDDNGVEEDNTSTDETNSSDDTEDESQTQHNKTTPPASKQLQQSLTQSLLHQTNTNTNANTPTNNNQTSTSQHQHQKQDLPESEFSKQFWSKRGDNNRAWKARRRTVLKEKRQRENNRVRNLYPK